MFSWVKKEEETVKKDFIKIEKFFWNYKNLLTLALSVVLAIFILKSNFIKTFIFGLGNLEYIGAFISGAFFSYGLTTAPAISMLYLFSRDLHPVDVAAFGAVGAFLSDFLIFKFIKNNLSGELRRISKKLNFHPHLNMRLLRKFAPLIAGIIIASPLPDELAVSILGGIKASDKQFVFISITSNFIGILIIGLL